ncbi:MAG: glycine/betaine/sarcosine/D-proline family reductase selenoprotein B [Acidobacteria bacterium]|nr:MAG: glycine/betaine/sarcosine/D-proline family reductase selenoprotein B [Acidobacteriota bacterium]
MGLETRRGPVGPGLGLQQALGSDGEIIATLICGDNYFNMQMATVRTAVLDIVRDLRPDILVAGPAFNAGRYGMACGEVCKVIAEQARIPTVTAMYPENPAVETYRRVPNLWILPTRATAADMRAVLPRLAALIRKLGHGEPLGPAQAEGLIPRGQRVLTTTSLPGAERAIAMLLAKLRGRPFQTELPLYQLESVPPAPPVAELKMARLATLTTAGLVPRGNPDGFKVFNATRWGRYRLPDAPTLNGQDWEIIHGGFNTAYAQRNPNLVLPFDVLRELVGEMIGELDEYVYSITGVGTSLAVAKQAGEAIATSLREDRVDAALLVAT